jgi:sensor histidine kinase YesM
MLSGISSILLERLFLKEASLTWGELFGQWLETAFDIFAGMGIYWLVLLILLALDYYRKFREQYAHVLDLEKDLNRAQMNALQMQLRPHFLFNAFNTIAMMIRQKKNDSAIDMITSLAEMFRFSLRKNTGQFVTLEEEIGFLKKYLAIESVRFGDRLTIDWQIDPDSKSAKVPSFILQPIVENAFKHGLSHSQGNVSLRISSKTLEDLISLEIFNSGPNLPENWELNKEKGIGISNTIDRLMKLYENKFRFIINQKEDGISMELRIPCLRNGVPMRSGHG